MDSHTGITISWGVAHRDNQGNLISRHVSIESPEAPACNTLRCLWSYLKETLLYVLVMSYHRRRAVYAEANRGKKILERYRTGEPSPQTLWQAVHANIKLTCPMCRKYNLDPLLRR